MTISSTNIKSIQDIMRKDAGVDGDAQRISQLVWMIFLKVFDDKEQEINKSKLQAEQLMQSVLKDTFEQKEELLVES